MLKEILILFLITLVPFVELRGSIPYGIGVLGLNWFVVFLIAIISNAIIGVFVYLFLDKFVHYLLRYKLISRFYFKIIENKQKKIKKYVDKYGEMGVAIFIAIPLPGTGSYSAALGSYLIGLNLKKFIIANLIGVIIAGIIVSLATLGIIKILF